MKWKNKTHVPNHQPVIVVHHDVHGFSHFSMDFHRFPMDFCGLSFIYWEIEDENPQRPKWSSSDLQGLGPSVPASGLLFGLIPSLTKKVPRAPYGQFFGGFHHSCSIFVPLNCTKMILIIDHQELKTEIPSLKVKWRLGLPRSWVFTTVATKQLLDVQWWFGYVPSGYLT